MKGSLSRLLLLLMLFTWVLPIPLAIAGEGTGELSNGEYLQDVMNLVKDNYHFDVDNTQLLENAIKGMFYSLDDYTEFYTTEEAEQFLQSVDGRYEGIGVVLTCLGDYVMITQVFPLSPAEKAGLFSGDKIASVDGKDVRGKGVDEVAALIKGEEGSRVSLGIIRDNNDKLLSISVARGRIKLNPVNYNIRDGIGYISIETFNSNTNEYLLQALTDMEYNGIEKVILDLRNNTGGEVSQAVAVARNFVPEGLIATLEFRAPSRGDLIYESSLKSTKYQLVVLVNGMTASSSEILAGAIQDSGAGILVGTKTYGKARVQSIIPILTPEACNIYGKYFSARIVDGNSLLSRYGVQAGSDEIIGWAKITTGIYKTPKGRNIDGYGLTPDIVVGDHEPVAGIYLNSIADLSRTAKPGLNEEGIDVYNAEKILRISGYDVDVPDMRLDERTYAAIKDFQRDNALHSYGVLDYSTQDALNKKLQQLLKEIDKQYARAVQYLKNENI